MRILMPVIFALLALLLAFFGIGPVLFADGSTTERTVTLLIVLVCYAVLGLIYRAWAKRNRAR